jgi:hypothetical protein
MLRDFPCSLAFHEVLYLIVVIFQDLLNCVAILHKFKHAVILGERKNLVRREFEIQVDLFEKRIHQRDDL